MARFLVLPGSVAVASDRLVQILGLNVDGSIEARDLANGSTFNCDPSLLKAAPRARHGQAGAAQRIDVAVDNDRETAHQREAVLRTISEQGNLSRQVADAAANLGVSVRTVFRWLAAYRQLPQTSSLLPNPMGPPKGTKRIDAKVEEVIESVINDVYLSKPRAKKEEVARMVGLRCEAMGLKAPSRKPILARLSALDKSVVAKARLEPGEAAALVDFVPGTYKVVKPLDVVQIDHTLADVIVVDEENRLPIGRPWLTLAVDVATRVIVGFYVSLEAPSSTSVALCIAQAVLPKEQWLRQRELNCVWPVWGLPKAVHADNGADFTAAALRRGCDEHGIKLILRPIANPHYGAHRAFDWNHHGSRAPPARIYGFEPTRQRAVSGGSTGSSHYGGAGAMAGTGDLRAIPSAHPQGDPKIPFGGLGAGGAWAGPHRALPTRAAGAIHSELPSLRGEKAAQGWPAHVSHPLLGQRSAGIGQAGRADSCSI